MDFNPRTIFQGFDRIARSFIKTIAQVFRRTKKSATGQTVSSLRSAISFSIIPLAINLDIFGSKVFDYIRDGRPPGSKMPPQGVLIDWMKARGIPIAAEFVIRRSIAIKGIEPEPQILEAAFTQIQSDFFNVAAPEFLQKVSNLASSFLPKDFEFKAI